MSEALSPSFPRAVTRRPPLLWDVLAEHLEEASFLWTQRERAMDSPDDTLLEVEAGDEARLRAHLDGLRVGGPPVALRILRPALESEEPGGVASAAFVLLASGEQALVLERWGEDAERRPWLRHALALCERQELDAALLDLLPRLVPTLQAELLDLLAFRQVDAGSLLERLVLADTEPVLLAAAFRAARVTKPPVLATWLRKGMEDARPLVRDAAIETGLLRGLRAAWQSCQRLATEGAEPRLAMLALAAGGAPADVEKLVRALDRSELRAEALWALGFSGRLAAADAALAVLKEQTPEVAWLALRTFSVITGLSTEGLFMRGDDEDDVAPPSGAVSSSLPPPEHRPGRVQVAEVERWWARARKRFEPEGRYRDGVPWTPEALLQALHLAPMRHRPALAFELAVRSRGGCQVETRGWCGHQRARLRAAGALSLERLTRGFDAWMNA
ncbi:MULTISPECIES: TIGR02270 family protein [Myxococcus]|uniref:TIGR02270 family protein n=1 Tax=Myxococcus TaxID=32 RepID=UPI001144F217|nr:MULTISPECIES: TIGR02270 family protein [Myxococcus]NOK01586.1 TIGR02270 family protein [Myxococcus xanthus]